MASHVLQIRMEEDDWLDLIQARETKRETLPMRVYSSGLSGFVRYLLEIYLSQVPGTKLYQESRQRKYAGIRIQPKKVPYRNPDLIDDWVE